MYCSTFRKILRHFCSTVLLLVAVALLVLAIITKPENQPTTSYNNSVREINNKLCDLKLGKAANCSVEGSNPPVQCLDENTRFINGQCCKIDRIDSNNECCPQHRNMTIKTNTCCLEGQALSTDKSSCESNPPVQCRSDQIYDDKKCVCPDDKIEANGECVSKSDDEPSRLQKTTIIWILLFIIAVICAFLLILYCTRSNDKAAQGVVGAFDKTNEQNTQGLESEYQFQPQVDAE